ncbi:DUF5330 domain-containing protein [uncultured Martelella sp.]|uniref:DUF5330 domain-containing protein n=1 Tax=uncultured Martelella sp. TaxID=392331 RepID=UPI0029C923D6|nr:DUF5330 domain-containing protein [uncultured Martelella sp.]
MRFLLKSAFMIFLLLLIVPFFAPVLLGSNSGRHHSALPNSSDIGGAVSAARGTIDYMSGMCDERPDVCDDGAGLLGFLGNRARQGAEIVYLYLDAQFSDTAEEKPEAPAPAASKTTRPADVAPAGTTVSDRMAEEPSTQTDFIRTGAIAPQDRQPSTATEPVRISGLPENVPLPTPRPR